MTPAARGLAALLAACTLWGLSVLYWRMLNPVPPAELLAHRIAGSLVWFGAALLLMGQGRAALRLIAGPFRWRVALAALCITSNWLFLILAVQWGMMTEASLGYYIFPLFAVAVGVVAFGERLGALQGAAVALAGAGVGVLTWGLGAAPWIALLLAFTFAVYGALKKGITAGPVVSVTAEVMLLAPLALVWLALVHAGVAAEARPGAVFGRDPWLTVLLLAAGPVTAVPLMLFTYASRRVSMATLGLGQYINPTIQFLCAVAVAGEPFTRWHAAAFAMIWAAVALYGVAAVRQDRAARSRPISAGTSFTTAA